MTFGWQGFSLEHPDDWAPVQLTGDRDEGYVRIASPTRLACQLRWKKAPLGDDLVGRLRTYLSRLERDAKKSKQAFDADLEMEGSQITYRYRGVNFGRGAIFFSEPCSRVFFLELISPKNESTLSLYRQLVETFRSGDRDRWSLLGLDVLLPAGLKVEKTTLEAGHTRLDLKGKGVAIQAERWGFGEQLASKHGLEPWAREALGLQKANVVEEACGLRYRKSGLVRAEALVSLQPDHNRIVALIVKSRKKEWSPNWDWIVS